MKNVCRFYTQGNCKFGKTCRQEHPKVCQKFRSHGLKKFNAKGCEEKCNDYHPKACYEAIKQKTCQRVACKFFHINGTKNQNNSLIPLKECPTHRVPLPIPTVNRALKSKTKPDQADGKPPRTSFFRKPQNHGTCNREASSSDGANANHAASASVSGSESIHTAKLQHRTPKIQTTNWSPNLGMCSTGTTKYLFPKVSTNTRIKK